MDTPSLLTILATILPLLHLLGIISAIDVLFRTASSQGAIAWCLFLTIFPILGLPIYWTLGRSRFHGYTQRISRVLQHSQKELQWYREQVREHATVPADPEPGRAETLARIAQASFVGGNAVELLVDGQATFDAILSAIDCAQSYVLVEFFIIKDDQIGRDFKGSLIAAARRGVSVFLLYDEVGSHDLPSSYLDELREAGVQESCFGTRRGGFRNFFQVNFRNHRKIVVIDGQVAFNGGLNVGDEYLGRSKRFGRWRDTHIKISGPAALHLKSIFFADWVWATGSPPSVRMLPPTPSGATVMLTIPSGPADGREAALLFFLHAISSARSRVWIASPYFIPDDSVTGALKLAALRGVDVRIILPQKRDHLIVWLASFFFIPLVCARGTKAFRYTGGFLHEKVVVIDDHYASVGSANCDNRSFRLNFEATSVVADSAFVNRVASMLEEDMANSVDVSQQKPSGLPFWKRVGSSIARLFSPVL